MTQLDFTLEAIRGMDDPCQCERCHNWVAPSHLRPVNGSINERVFHRENRDIEVDQTIWLCLDCYDTNN